MTTIHHIDHIGFIRKVKDGIVYVSLARASACGACSAKNICGEGNSERDSFEIPVKEGKWLPGDEVIVRLQASKGFLAVMFAYLIPCLIVVATLLICIEVGFIESNAGIMSIAILLPYYGMLHMLRKWINRKFILKIIKR